MSFKPFFRIGLFLLLILIVGILYYSPMEYYGPKSDHFDGKRFFNYDRSNIKNLDVLVWQFSKNKKKWPKWLKANRGLVPIRRVEDNELFITFINHSTILIQVAGINILTDPIWSETAGVFNFGPKKHTNSLGHIPTIR